MNSGHANRQLSREVEKLQYKEKMKDQNFLPLKSATVRQNRLSGICLHYTQTEIKGGKPRGKKNEGYTMKNIEADFR
jgi:hypothetical protein